MKKYCIKHSSGFYYKEDDSKQRFIDCFSTMTIASATQFELIDAQRFIVDNLGEFMPACLSIVEKEN